MRSIPSVLVIDDNPDTLQTLVALLASLGVQSVTEANSAEQALGILKSQQFSMIVSDYRLGGMDGVEFVERLRADGDPTPVLMISGAPDKSGVIRANQLINVDFFAKPFRLADLMVAMDRMAA